MLGVAKALICGVRKPWFERPWFAGVENGSRFSSVPTSCSGRKSFGFRTGVITCFSTLLSSWSRRSRSPFSFWVGFAFFSSTGSVDIFSFSSSLFGAFFLTSSFLPFIFAGALLLLGCLPFLLGDNLKFPSSGSCLWLRTLYRLRAWRLVVPSFKAALESAQIFSSSL